MKERINTIQQEQQEYYACLYRAVEEVGCTGTSADGIASMMDDEQTIAKLAGYCRQAGLEEEACVMRTLWQSRFALDEDTIRRIFRVAYMQPSEGKAVSQMNLKERIARTIRDFFQRRYQLRYNEVKQMVEFRANDGTDAVWMPMSDRDLKRIAFEEMLEGGHGWPIDVELYVHSSLVPSYHPVRAYLKEVGKWNGRYDYIGAYARRLKTNYKHWEKFFHRWFLAMVAQALNMSRDHGNSMVPLLIGTQAMKKSTFCKNILPYELREYYMDDIKMDNAEQVERVMGRMWLVNIDEYNSKTEREQAKIKRLLTEKDVQIRKIRSDQYTMTARLCSFIATTNERQPLCDSTGSRRYLCVEMTGQANMSGKVNYRQMYAQAVYELQHGARYWFTTKEERKIVEHNRPYQQRSSVEDMIASIFEPCERNKDHFLTTTAIQQQLRHRVTATDVPTLRRLGLALKRQHFPEGSVGGAHGYYMKLKEGREGVLND